MNGTITVNGAVGAEVVVQAVARTGMTVERWTEANLLAVDDESDSERWGRTALTTTSGVATAAGSALHTRIAGSIAAPLGSEGVGGVREVPLPARVAVDAAGTDAAIESADIALMSDDLTRLPWLVEHSRRTLAIVRQNIGFSLAAKAVFAALTFTGHASLRSAIAADLGASLLVTFNGLRLLGGRPGAAGA